MLSLKIDFVLKGSLRSVTPFSFDNARLYNFIFEIILIKFFFKYGHRRGLGSNECMFLKFWDNLYEYTPL